MKITEIAFTAYPVTDLQRARAIYEGVLGLKPASIFGDDNTAWIEYLIGDAALSIGNGAPDWKPSAGGGAVGLEVDNFAESVAFLKKQGVKFVLDPIETPVCQMAVVSDPDGNSITLHKRKAG